MLANTSITNATRAKPAHVATYVKSVTRNAFGRGATRLPRAKSAGRAPRDIRDRRLPPPPSPIFSATERTAAHRENPVRFNQL